jgi:hypothetical protein
MILYILRFSLALAIVFGFYRIFLEKEKSYHFNRFYLLGGLLVSLIVPLISFGASREIKQIINEMPVYVPTNYNTQVSMVVTIYWTITILFFVRFAYHIYVFVQKIRKNETLRNGHATIVLTKQKTTPHSFLGYIFINKEQYKTIPPELLKHELAHVLQFHTFDIFFIEFVKNLVWINPMLILYKRAMQLNHELLADNSVVHSHGDVKYYQGLLLDYLDAATVPLSCGFNFAITKKRLIMMKKQKSKIHRVKQGLVIPLFILVLIACSDNPGVSGEEMLKYWRSTANMEEILRTGTMNKEDLKKGIIVPIETKAQYDSLMDIYNRMNKAQKKSVYKLPAYLEPIKEK